MILQGRWIYLFVCYTLLFGCSTLKPGQIVQDTWYIVQDNGALGVINFTDSTVSLTQINGTDSTITLPYSVIYPLKDRLMIPILIKENSYQPLILYDLKKRRTFKMDFTVPNYPTPEASLAFVDSTTVFAFTMFHEDYLPTLSNLRDIETLTHREYINFFKTLGQYISNEPTPSSHQLLVAYLHDLRINPLHPRSILDRLDSLFVGINGYNEYYFDLDTISIADLKVKQISLDNSQEQLARIGPFHDWGHSNELSDIPYGPNPVQNSDGKKVVNNYDHLDSIFYRVKAKVFVVGEFRELRFVERSDHYSMYYANLLETGLRIPN